ncbi:MAG: YncE family protein [Muribaculaceae bacterium]|nr:YncE family protein [Muribaculaceae bacterium]
MKLTKLLIIPAVVSSLSFTACSDEPTTPRSETEYIYDADAGGDIAGFYVLNEGNMGSNKCTLDYFDYNTKTYTRNIYAEMNPDQPLELGDSGYDIAVYNGRVYIVVTGSKKVEVLDATTTRRIGEVNIDAPRNLAFSGDYMYVSNFSGGEGSNGSVVKVKLDDLSIEGKCAVGMGPEEMVITDGKLYVANSSDYVNYDDKISVIDLSTFTVTASIQCGVNMRCLRLDDFGNMWAVAQGNYNDIAGSLIMLKKTNGEYAKSQEYDYACSRLAINSGTMYFYTTEYAADWSTTVRYYKADINANGINGTPAPFLTDATANGIVGAYGIFVQPSNGTIFITDAVNYVSSGKINCFDQSGKLLWKATTGDIPGHIAFVRK